MRRLGPLAVLLLLAVAAAAALLSRIGIEEREQRAARPPPSPVVLENEDGRWTVETRCRSGRGFTVGPGYVSRLVTRDGAVVVDDVREQGTLNDPEYGGLGAFGWHHARGRPGATRFHADNAWEISGRACARDTGGFGVVGSRVLVRPRAGDPTPRLVVDVLLADAYTAPRPLVRVRYAYTVRASQLVARITVTQLCPRGRCGRTRATAFVKEPKLVAHVTGGGFTRMLTLDTSGRGVCQDVRAGPESGPILETGQCGADGRARMRFDFGSATSGVDGGCDARACLDVGMRSATGAWESGAGLDRWAMLAARRPAAYAADTASIDGVVWDCHGGSPAADLQRRWETAARGTPAAGYSAHGALFPAWEGGRGGYDCEPLARAFGPHGESFTVVASYSLTP